LKQLITGIAILLLFASCKNENKAIVSIAFTDSLLNNYSDSAVKNAFETDLQFWKSRIIPESPGMINELKYAGCLVQRFHLTGDMQDLVTSDSILFVADRAFDHKEMGPNMALIRNCILQHRFKMADSLLQQAKKTGIKKYESAILGFDVAFELGYYPVAAFELKQIASPTDYGYNFRWAKLAHYKGEMDTAIAAMHRAGEQAAGNVSLRQVTLSNEADLNLHKGNIQRANELYVQSIRLSATDLHSVMALGWIALVHDKNDSLAEKIFRFVQSKTKAPDAVFKLTQLADARGDSGMQKKYASEFVAIATAPVYGNMYNKYVLELYTGILNEPSKAEAMAARELLNRTTPQTYAWYVWALYSNNKIAEAEKVYQQHVSDKPLEGLELYWMGKYMQAKNKGYNAQQFFKAAYKNRYDLSPGMVRGLEKELGE
jgi:tetratricopeptide (TPR) repeat protein